MQTRRWVDVRRRGFADDASGIEDGTSLSRCLKLQKLQSDRRVDLRLSAEFGPRFSSALLKGLTGPERGISTDKTS